MCASSSSTIPSCSPSPPSRSTSSSRSISCFWSLRKCSCRCCEGRINLPYFTARKIHSSLTRPHILTPQPKRNNVRRRNAQNLGREMLHDLLSALRQSLYRPSHFNHARLPGRRNIIHYKGRAP